MMLSTMLRTSSIGMAKPMLSIEAVPLELKLTVGQKTQDALPQNTDSQSAQNEQSQQNEQYNYYYGQNGQNSQNGQSGFPFNFFN